MCVCAGYHVCISLACGITMQRTLEQMRQLCYPAAARSDMDNYHTCAFNTLLVLLFQIALHHTLQLEQQYSACCHHGIDMVLPLMYRTGSLSSCWLYVGHPSTRQQIHILIHTVCTCVLCRIVRIAYFKYVYMCRTALPQSVIQAPSKHRCCCGLSVTCWWIWYCVVLEDTHKFSLKAA